MVAATYEIDGTADIWQVQCQRTRRFIPVTPLEPTAVCPWCDEHETYLRLDAKHEAWQHVQRAIQMCRIEFGIPDDGHEAVVWLGDHPEAVFEKHLDRHNIYLGRDSDRWQFMYSGSHESFHRVCGGRKNAMHWADEMFAVLFSLLYLERIGETTHADKNRIGLIKGAQCISRQKMLNVTQGPLPGGFYGQAYLLGEELRQIVGWETLRDLATLRTAEGFPDVEAWIDSLAVEVREKVARLVLGSSAL
jgi:hypothetical protein